MSVLFQGIRENARNFEYPAPSVAALESVLIRLYLESPMGGSKPVPSIRGIELIHGQMSSTPDSPPGPQ